MRWTSGGSRLGGARRRMRSMKAAPTLLVLVAALGALIGAGSISLERLVVPLAPVLKSATPFIVRPPVIAAVPPVTDLAGRQAPAVLLLPEATPPSDRATLTPAAGEQRPPFLLDPVRGGYRLVARVGYPVRIAIDVTAGTGHKWWPLEPLPNGMRLVSQSFAPYSSLRSASAFRSLATAERPGGSVRQFFVFEPARSGRMQVILVFRRSWVPPSATDARLVLTFIVAD